MPKPIRRRVMMITAVTPGLRSSPPIFEIRGRLSGYSSAQAEEFSKINWVKTSAVRILLFKKPSSVVIFLV